MRTFTVLGGAVLVGLVVAALPAAGPAVAPSYPETISGCRVTDGDTIRCGEERIRLLGIDAPELRGCPPRRRCVEGDGLASTTSLARAMAPRMNINRVGRDRYGRTLAIISANGRDLSCHQLEAGQAEYRADWDNGLLVARACPTSVL